MTPTSAVFQAEPGVGRDGHDFRRLADALPGLVELLDANGKRLYLNKACALIFPHPESMSGTCPADDSGLQNPDDMRSMLARVFQSGQVESRRYERVLPDGTRRWFECRAIPLPAGSEQDRPAVMLISSRAGQRQQMEQLLNEYKLRLQLAQQIKSLGSWEYDFRSDTLLMSEGFARIFGVPPQTTSMNRQHLYELVHPEDRERLFNLRKELEEKTGSVYEVQYRIIRTDGQTRTLHSHWCLEVDEAGRLYRSLGFCEDITDRVAAEKTALASAEHFHFLAVNVQDMAIFLLDLDGRVASWNPGAERLYGYRPAEILNRHYSIFFLPGMSDANVLSAQLESAGLNGKFETQDWRVRKDGDRFLARITVMPFFDKSGEHTGYMKLTHDLTKQLCMEDILRSHADRLKVNARRLVELQESERHHLARELHDLVGPKLTALGINLQLINSRLSEESNNSVAEVLRESVNYVHGTIDILRYIIGELRPHALDDFGLRAALRSHVAQFMRLTGIRVNIEESNVTAHVPDMIKMSLFRITQEALNNIVRHSQATTVDIAIIHADGNISLSIRDNGIGFDENDMDMNSMSQSYGLSIMRERAEAIGAGFRLETGVGEGVRIHVECRI